MYCELMSEVASESECFDFSMFLSDIVDYLPGIVRASVISDDYFERKTGFPKNG